MLVFQQKQVPMKQFLSLLTACPLMADIPSQEVLQALSCMDAQVLFFKKGNIILQQDDPARFFGVVLEGCVQIIRGDVQGSHVMITSLSPGELFGETFACASPAALPVNVVAKADSTILLLEHARIASVCARPCGAHFRLLLNLLRLTSDKNLLLNRKLDIVMKRTTREKLMAYLSTQAQQAGSEDFSIPFDRQELADYLGVERSAMSTELNRLKKDGIIDFHKNTFRILSC